MKSYFVVLGAIAAISIPAITYGVYSHLNADVDNVKGEEETPIPKQPSTINPNSMIEIADDAVGYRYKDYLLVDRNDALWGKKVADWKEAYLDKEVNRRLMKDFRPDSYSDVTISTLQRNCERGYNEKSWNIPGMSWRKVEQILYWDQVASFCSKDLMKLPWSWNEGK